MSESQSPKTGKTPWHLWLIGIVGLLWNAMGAFDYVMTQTKNESYMSGFTPEQLSFFYGLPTWVVAAWAIAVWSSVIGSILLLMKKSVAVPVFLVSLIAMVITTIQNFGFSNGLDVMGDTFSLVFTAVIFVSAMGLYMYSRAMKRQGVLK